MVHINDLFKRCVAEVLGPERPILTSDEFFAVLQHIGKNYSSNSEVGKELSEMARQIINDRKTDRPTREIKKSDYFCGIKNSFDTYVRSR